MKKTDHAHAVKFVKGLRVLSIQKFRLPGFAFKNSWQGFQSAKIFWLLFYLICISGPAAVYAQAPPVANDISFTVKNTGDSYVYVLLNDEEGDHPIDPESIEIVSPPAHADDLVLEPPGVLIYELNAAISETSDSFTYRVSDTEGNVSNTATVTIEIIEAFDFTADRNYHLYVGEEVSPQIDLTQSTIYPGGVDDSTIELLEVSDPGGIQSIEDGILTYQHPSPLPDPEFFEFSYKYTVQSVDGTYSPPVSHWLTFSDWVNVPFTVDAGVETELDVVAHFDELTEDDLSGISDFRMDEQSITILQDPAKGTAVTDPDNAFIIHYTANADAGGSDEFVIQGLSEFSGLPAAIYKVQLDIVENAPPVFTSVINEETVTEGEEFTFQFEADDSDGDDLSFALTSGGDVENASISGDGLFSFAPDAGQAGEYTFTVEVSDGILTDEHDFTIEVVQPNQSPVFTNTFDEENVTEGEEFTFQFEADDPDGDDLTFSLTQGGDVENTSITTEGLFSFSPEAGQAGSYDFTVQVSDGELTTDHDFTVVVLVEPNDPPVFTATFDEAAVFEGEEFTFQFEANDPDGDDLTFSLTQDGDVENASITTEGLFSFAPEAGQVGSYEFTVHVSDGELTSDHDFTVIVQEEPNELPAFSSTPVTIVQVGEIYRYEVEAGDPDGDPLTLTAPVLPEWLAFTDNGDGTGVLEGTPSATDLGGHAVELQAGDGDAAATQEFTIDVREEPNEAPVFTTTFDEETIVEGEEFSFQFEADDPDGDDLAFSLAAGGDVENVSITTEGLFSFAPEAGQAGTYNFTVQVSDGELTADYDFSIIVQEELNEAPVFSSTPVTIVQVGELYQYEIEIGDPDEDLLTLTAPALPGWLTFTDNGDGTGLLEGTPSASNLGENEVVLQVSDGDLTATQEFIIDVREEPNEPPFFTTTFDEESVVEGEEFTFQFEAEDPDGDDLTFTLTNPGDVENASITAEGLFSFAPDTGQVGEYAFTVEVRDGELTDDHDFTIIVGKVSNESPVFTATFNEEVVVEGEEFTYQFEAEDPEGKTLTFTLSGGMNVENVSLTEEGLFTFSPEFGQAGEYEFTVEASDGELSADHSFTIVVEKGNRPPEARNITISTRINIPVTIDLTEFVSDPDGDHLEIINVSVPQHGETDLNQNSVTYTSALNFTGTDSFGYTVADEEGVTDNGLVTIEILGLAFHIHDLGSPGGSASRAFDISDEGHVAGIFSGSNGSGSAFIWADGEFKTIPGMKQVFGVNNSGNLAGITELGGSVLPAMYLNGTLVPGTTMGGNFGALYDINNSNIGVGVADDASGSIVGFLWDENGQQPVVPDDMDLQLYSINDSGVLAGFAQFENGQEQAVRVLPEGTVQLLSNGSESGSRAFGAGNGGHIVGVIHNSNTIRGALWQNDSVHELPGLGGSTTIAYGVNNSGVIVGTSGTGSQKQKVKSDILQQMTGLLSGRHGRSKSTAEAGIELQNTAQLANDEGLRAVLWIDDDMIDLNELIPSGSGWELVEARAINNHMDIVGYGRLNGEIRAFMLNPADVENPVAETSVQQVTGGQETLVDLHQQLKNIYGQPTVTEIWGGSHGIAELRQERYLRYKIHLNTIAKADTVHYRVVDQRGAVAEGDVIFNLKDLPGSFELSQNYPNPFNSSTVIPFKLAENGRVVVELYSIDGRRVGVLMDQTLPRGIHRTKLGNMALSSGIYFYRLRVINGSGQPVFTETRKMSLVK